MPLPCVVERRSVAPTAAGRSSDSAEVEEERVKVYRPAKQSRGRGRLSPEALLRVLRLGGHRNLARC